MRKPTHMLVEIHKDGFDTVATTECGEQRRCRSRAAVFEDMTAWPSLTDCPECLEKFSCPSAA